jgi:hypothetical protein
MENNTLWFTQAQIAKIFGRKLSVITKHLRNIFDENELEEKSNVQNLHIANSDKPTAFYSLDKVIAECKKYCQCAIDELLLSEQDFLEMIKNAQKKLEGKTKHSKKGGEWNEQ